MKLLFLSNWYPDPPDNGSKLRIFNLLKGLRGGASQPNEITLISFTDRPENGAPHAASQRLQKLCRKVVTIPTRDYNPTSGRALRGFLSSRPRVLVDRYAPEMEAAIQAELEAQPYDLIVASQWYMADYYRRSWNIPAIFEEVEVGVFMDKIAQARNPMARLRHELTSLKMSYYFRNLLSDFSACTVVSEKERQLLKQMAPDYDAVEVVPNGVNLGDTAGSWPPPEPDTLIFTGSFRYAPNYAAMEWFTQ
jgi:hypothetical protein